jgi:hypothetical protein
LDQRNVLLDDPILDFLAKVPDPLRIDKMLYRRAVARAYPRLAQFPFARRSNFEDWGKLLSTESPVRAYVLEELNDQSSGIWEFLDPLSLTKLLGLLEKGSGFRSILNPRINPRSLVRRGFEILAPSLLARIQGQRRARPVSQLGVEKIIMQALVLKHWYDTFAQA